MKLVIFIVLIGILCYLIYIEYLQNKNNNNEYNNIQFRAAGELGNILSANLRGLGTILIGGPTIYQGNSQLKKDMGIKSEAIKNLENQKTILEIENVKSILTQIREEGRFKNINLS
jgi:hypothetical protein